MTARARKRSVDWARTSKFSVGPISIDVSMAVAHGWEAKQLDRAAVAIGRLARREALNSHRYGPVSKCPCEACDLRVKDADLAQPEAKRQRLRWRQRGLIK